MNLIVFCGSALNRPTHASYIPELSVFALKLKEKKHLDWALSSLRTGDCNLISIFEHEGIARFPSILESLERKVAITINADDKGHYLCKVGSPTHDYVYLTDKSKLGNKQVISIESGGEYIECNVEDTVSFELVEAAVEHFVEFGQASKTLNWE